jgi:hypothetical protein
VRSLYLIVGVLFAIAAIVVVTVVPDRTQVVLYIASGGANEVVIPAGFWAAAAVWAWLASRLTNEPWLRVLPAAIAVGMGVHLLLLLAMFAPQLADPARFSTSFYLIYARVFCGLALAFALGGSAWALSRNRPDGAVSIFAVPVLAGAGMLAIALVRYDLPAAAGALVLAAIGWRWQTTAGLARRVLADERLFMIAVFLVALALRLLYLRRVMTDPGYVATGGDGPIYDALAWSIARGEGVPASFREGYPLLLLGYVWFAGGVYAVAGHSYFILCAVQSVLGALACVLLYLVARSLVGAAVARVASVFAAVSFPLLFAAAAIGHQAVDVFLTVLITWLLLRAVDARDTGAARWAGIGVLLGCAVAVRETSAFFLAFVLGWIAFAFKRRLMIGSLPAAAWVVAGVVLVVMPLAVPAVSTPEGRVRLRQHFDRLYTGQGDAVRTRKELIGPLEDPGAALAQAREQPAFVAVTLSRAIVHNFAVQFFTQPFGGMDLVFLAKGSAYYYGLWFYAYALAAAGAIMAARTVLAGSAGAVGTALVLGIIVFRTLPHLVLESHYRHRVPIEPLLILLAALAAVTVFAAGATSLKRMTASHG